MMNKTLLDELDKSSYAAGPLIGTMLGAVLGPVILVAIAVGRSVEAGGYTRGAAVALVVVKALQFCLFVAAAVFLYRSVIEFS